MLTESDLHNYQGTARKHINTHPFAGLFLDMGLGKTISTLSALNDLLFDTFEIRKALIIGTKRVVENVWSDEIENWSHTQHLKISRIIGNKQQREKALHETAHIYAISRDNIAWLCAFFGGSKLPFDALIIDESSSFKNHKSVRFKALKRVAPSFERVVILTGTPAPNTLIDLWPQIYLLDQGKRLGLTISEYRNNYFRANQRRGNVVYNYKVLPNSEAIIHSKIKDICISMKAKDYLDMPNKVVNYIKLKLSPQLLLKYKLFEAEMVLELVKEDITAANAAALSAKLLQFSNGAIYDENRDVHEVHDVKLKALEEIVEDSNGKPILVAYNFKHDLHRIKNTLRQFKPTVLATSGDMKAWNSKKIQLGLLHPASGGHGLNLQKGGNIIVWFGLNWSLELYLQLNARLHRQGQTEQVFVHHLVVENTIDALVIDRLAQKFKTQEELLRALKSRVDKIKKQYGRKN